MFKVLITTVPFGEIDRKPLDLLEASNIDYVINPLNKKLTEGELLDLITDFDAIIAGTEEITEKVLIKGANLKLISRVGIGLDSVDLLAAEKLKIAVSYTPDAPAPAVVDLTTLSEVCGFTTQLMQSDAAPISLVITHLPVTAYLHRLM